MTKDRLVIGREHLIAMLRDPEFYKDCPAYAELETSAAAGYAAYRLAVKKGACGTCGGASFPFMRTAVTAFWEKCQELKKSGDLETLRTVKTYLEKRKHYRIKQVVIYYRRSRSQKTMDKFVIT